MVSRGGRFGTLALWVLVAILAVRLAIFAVDIATRRSDGFGAYYTASRLLHDGAPVSRFYDDDWFGARVQDEAPGVRDIFFVNPPTAALLLLPLARLSYEHARMIWTALNLVMLIVAAGWMAREARLGRALAPAFLCLVFVNQPVWANFNQGQAYVFLLLVLVAAWWGYRRHRPAALGVALGVALVLKTAGVLLVPMLLVQRRWRAVAWTAGTAAAIVLVSLPWMGIASWHAYLERLLALSSTPSLAVTAYQTLPGLFRHLTTPDAIWNPGPLIAAPGLGRALGLLAFIVPAGAAIYAAIATRCADLAFAAALIATLVVSPLSLDYHYPMLLLPTAILLTWVAREGDRRSWAVLAIAIILIALDLPYRSDALRDGLWAVLAYPKLLGAILLCGLAIFASLRATEVAHEDRAHRPRLQRQRV